MPQVVTAFLAALAAFVVLDGLWLGVVMKTFYRDQLAHLARMAEGGLAPLWAPAALVYVLLALGIAVFVVPPGTSLASAAGLGAVLGLVVYGVYDLTNYSTLARWPGLLTAVDIVWGASACAAAGAISWWAVHRQGTWL